MIRTTLKPWDVPNKVWERIHIDYCGPIAGSMWLIIVDEKSKWPEVCKMNSTSTEKTGEKLRTTFSTHEIPKQLISDNGPQFTSQEFLKFCDIRGIKHTLTPPYHPQSNGEAERFVQTFKRALGKNIVMERKISAALPDIMLQYRITPDPATKISPAMMILGRQPRTLLNLIKPIESRKQSTEEPEEETRYRKKMIEFHDKKSNDRKFDEGNIVYVRNYIE